MLKEAIAQWVFGCLGNANTAKHPTVHHAQVYTSFARHLYYLCITLATTPVTMDHMLVTHEKILPIMCLS